MNQERDVTYIGRTDFRGAKRLFGVKRNDRRQHMYIIGKTGTGKSTLITNLAVQDISNGEGLCVVDPHGELVATLLSSIPESRLNDVIYFNPADFDSQIGFNILEIPDPRYKHLVASGLMGIFTKIWAGTWSARMEYILNNSVLALLENPGSTLLGIPKLLVDKEYRREIVGNVSDPVVRAFWVNEYEAWEPKFRNEAIAPILNKVGQFLSTALIRNIVGQSKSTIDIFSLMNEGKIFLVNLSKGLVGEDNSALLGAMIITKIQLAAMERVRISEEERTDFYLYVDEFQNFATDSFASILSEARKYRLNLIVAHQYIGQLVTDASTRVRDAIFGNVGTMLAFRVGAADAEFLEKEFTPEFTVQDIVNLPNRRIYLKLMVNGVASRPFSGETMAPFRAAGVSLPEAEVVEHSRKRYARPREIVEEEINQWSGSSTSSQLSSRSGDSGGAGDRRTSRSRRTPSIPDAAFLSSVGIGYEETRSSGPARSTPPRSAPPSSPAPTIRPSTPRPTGTPPPPYRTPGRAAVPEQRAARTPDRDRRPRPATYQRVAFTTTDTPRSTNPRSGDGGVRPALSLSKLAERAPRSERPDRAAREPDSADISALRKAIADALQHDTDGDRTRTSSS